MTSDKRNIAQGEPAEVRDMCTLLTPLVPRHFVHFTKAERALIVEAIEHAWPMLLALRRNAALDQDRHRAKLRLKQAIRIIKNIAPHKVNLIGRLEQSKAGK